MLVSFHDAANVAVVGATGGIGGALLRALSATSRVARVFALARRPVQTDDERDKQRMQHLSNFRCLKITTMEAPRR